MIRNSVILVVAVALLAACGSGGGGGSSSALTPAAYRAKMNNVCSQAKAGVAGLNSSTTPPTTAQMQKAFGVLKTMTTTFEGITPPSSLASSHATLVSSLKTLEGGVQKLIALKPGQSHSSAGMAAFGSLLTAAAGMQSSLTALKLTTCSKVLTGH